MKKLNIILTQNTFNCQWTIRKIERIKFMDDIYRDYCNILKGHYKVYFVRDDGIDDSYTIPFKVIEDNDTINVRIELCGDQFTDSTKGEFRKHIEDSFIMDYINYKLS